MNPIYKSKILNFYNNTNLKIQKTPTTNNRLCIDSDYTIYNSSYGIGDSLMTYLFDLNNTSNRNIKIFFPNKALLEVFHDYNPTIASIYSGESTSKAVNTGVIQSDYDCGGGHFLQKIQYICGLQYQSKPRPLLTNIHNTIKDKVVLTFDRGTAPQQHIHPRARILYPEHKQTIQKFINDNQHSYQFVEVGKTFSGLDNIDNQTGTGLQNTVKHIATCEYFFGMHNGLMHVAAGFEKKSIIIVNFPTAKNIYLPCLHEVNIPDIDWLYPQNIHLHQDDTGELVEFLTYENISKAFKGELYPFFEEKHLIT